ncbi:hypothetical protein BGZ96_003700 [Linnemannia gamsii]|uniref:Uncharacterized protein n=1 Tax=Linnemannia gamsii TaxID=64522 RepID=A0ABQ7JJB6_9FUNG|nr:hypothetical protein BGZ96_003700 [Linnemannia gamsii]
MPVHSYGVWVGKPISYVADGTNDPSPHINLIFKDDLLGSREHKAAINVASDGADSRLVYWRIKPFTHSITSKLETLDYGFHRLPIDGVVRGLDYTRGTPILDIRTGRILPHDLPGENNDILDVVKPVLDSAISQDAKVYIFGSSFGSGIHDVHMNQGNRGRHERDNGIFHDGGLVIRFPDGHWEAIFLAFALQRLWTDDRGDPYINSQTLAEILQPNGNDLNDD